MDHFKTVVMVAILLFSTYGGVMMEAHNDYVYDCIDFYKQPAFDHPSLANHTFHPEMRPSSMPTMMKSDIKLSVNDTEIRLKGKGCPIGTVTIRRITEEDRIREKLHVEKYGSIHNGLNAKNSETHYAIVRTRSNPTKYNGAVAGISIWNPLVQTSQYSSGQLVIRNGQDNIQVGWTVTPSLYLDYVPHLFIYTSVGATRCFNTYCPGFVIVDKDFVVDEVLRESRKGGPIYYVRFMIYKEKRDGHWWLVVGESLKSVGFWPKDIFNGDMATSVEWGGQAYSPHNVSSPPMGSGAFLKKDILYDAFCETVQIIDKDHGISDAKDIEPYVDSSRYQVKVLGEAGESFGTYFLWGGPGGVKW